MAQPRAAAAGDARDHRRGVSGPDTLKHQAFRADAACTPQTCAILDGN